MKTKKRTKLSITIDTDIYNKFEESIKEHCIDKSLLFDKFLSDWLKTQKPPV